MSYQITLQPSGRTFEVAQGERILGAAIKSGISLPYSCRQGACNTCVSRVIQGEFEIPPGVRDIKDAAGMAPLCIATARTDLVIEATELPAASPPRTGKTLVRAMRRVTPDVMIVELKLPISTPIRFIAGQYIDLETADGLRRSYSIASPPRPEGDVDLELHISRIADGRFGRHVFETMQVRDLMTFEGPLGTFFLREGSDRPILLVARGIGYAPLRAIILDALGKNLPRPIVLYWEGAVEGDLYAAAEARDWSCKHAGFEFRPVLSERNGGAARAALADIADLGTYDVYASGNSAFVNNLRETLAGWPADQFFAEAFLTSTDVMGAAG